MSRQAYGHTLGPVTAMDDPLMKVTKHWSLFMSRSTTTFHPPTAERPSGAAMGSSPTTRKCSLSGLIVRNGPVTCARTVATVNPTTNVATASSSNS